jgi:hypothetical protein
LAACCPTFSKACCAPLKMPAGRALNWRTFHCDYWGMPQWKAYVRIYMADIESKRRDVLPPLPREDRRRPHLPDYEL